MTPELGGNPFAPQDHVPKAPPAENARLPVQRLKAVGASRAAIAEAERRWASASPEERVHAREAFDALSDDELRAELPTMESGLAFASSVGSADAEVETSVVEGAAKLLEEAEANGSTVDSAREWVGEDRTRALAMLTAERRRPDTEQRKTLIEPLEARVRDD